MGLSRCSHRRRAAAFGLEAAAALVLLTGCGGRSTSSEEAIATFALTSRAGINTYAVVPDQLRLAAARYFRDLAVHASIAPLQAVRLDARNALYAEKGVHRTLSADTQRKIQPLLVTLQVASDRGDRPTMIASALDTDRLLSGDLSSAAETQAAFMLIDYAQLVIREQLQAQAPDWAAINRSLALADTKRKLLAGRQDMTPNRDFDADFEGLRTAVDLHDRAAVDAALAATRISFGAYRETEDKALPDQALASSAKGHQ